MVAQSIVTCLCRAGLECVSCVSVCEKHLVYPYLQSAEREDRVAMRER